MTTATESYKSTGLTFLAFATCASAALTTWEQSISSVVASHAKTLAKREEAQASQEVDQDYGLSSYALFANYDLGLHLWKMSQLCLLAEWEQSLEDWPKSGMTRNGKAYLLPHLARRTTERGSSLWPTPATVDHKQVSSNPDYWRRRQRTPGDKRQVPLAVVLVIGGNGEYDPAFSEWLMGFPIGWTDLEG